MLKKQDRMSSDPSFYVARDQSGSSKEVDFHYLIKKVKENNKKEKRKNIFFAGTAIATVVIAGFIISL